jgi:hypothetical protein
MAHATDIIVEQAKKQSGLRSQITVATIISS